MNEKAPIDRRGTRAAPFDPTRAAIARTVTESAAIPTFTVTATADVGRLLAGRSEFNRAMRPSGTKASVNAFVVRAAALALKAHPDAPSTGSGGCARSTRPRATRSRSVRETSP